MKKIETSKKTVLSWINKFATVVTAFALALIGIHLLGYITAPQIAIKTVGYLLITSSVVLLLKNLK